jgi:uncharacterized membrane protein YfcA
VTSRTALKLLAWLLLLALAIVTVAPIEFRPVTSLPPQVERGTALLVIGFVFGLAYPRHIVVMSVLLLVSTSVFEALQLLEPGRHARWSDLAVKLAGGGFGLVLGWLLTHRFRPDR